MSAAPAPSEVAVSPELKAPLSDGLEICYQTFGDAGDEPLLLVMGLGGPMTWWDADFCRLLATQGFHVVRYDNRDTGRSSRGKGRVTRSDVVRAFTGVSRKAPYSLADLADDAFGLLDHLGLDRAHVVGVSMGGMIAQTMAISRPERVRSLVSIMSTTGRRTVGWQDPRLFPMLLAPRMGSREDYIAGSARMWTHIGSPGFPVDLDVNRAKAAETYDRGISGSGILRQMAAILTQPNRSVDLRTLTMPSAVIHGTADRMVHISGGRATAAAIPDCELVTVAGMGHDMPEQLWETFADVIRRTADRAPR